MLSLLNLTSSMGYRVPVSLINDKKSRYTVGAYIACLRFATRFNEAAGSYGEYLEAFGIRVDLHKGASVELMKKAMARLAEVKILDIHQYKMARRSYSQGFVIPFKKEQGWKNKDFDLSVVFQVNEIKQACRVAKMNHWDGTTNNLFDILNTAAYLRSFMQAPADLIAPRERYKQSVAMIDYKTCLKAIGPSLEDHLAKIKTASLGVTQHLLLEEPHTKNRADILLAVNRTDVSQTQLTHTRTALRKFYDGYTLTVL